MYGIFVFSLVLITMIGNSDNVIVLPGGDVGVIANMELGNN